ncbi:MAG: adenylyl-sulfate kinase [Myxococcales bacterium]|nr:adenylyl-sulfate kinase [Myxococcales bacterium]
MADGQVVVISATAARQEWRDAVANQVGRIIRIWLTCDPKALRGARDIKGLYAASDAGEITRLPGQGLPFEAPEAPDLTFDTTARSADDVLRAAVAGLAALARGEGVGV